MATAAFTTVVDRGIGDPLTEPIWDDQLRDNVNQLAGAHQNLLTNGGFEIWQRGAGPFTTTATYGADRWLLSLGGGTLTVTKETTTVDGASAASLKAVAVTVQQQLQQKLEDFTQLRGKTVSFSVRVNQSVAAGATLVLQDSVGSDQSATSNTTGSFVTLTVTRTINASATSVTPTLQFAPGTYYFDNAMLVIGPAPAPYQPLHPQEDLARCQRYYEVVAVLNYLGSANGAHNMGQFVGWKVEKGGTPTITKNGTWAVTNCAQPTVGSASTSGFAIFTTATGAGAVQFTPNSADDTVTGEYNP